MRTIKIKAPQLNIAMIGHKRIPSHEGGIEVVVETLADRMARLGHKVTCYNRKGHHVSGREYDIGFQRKEYRGIVLKSVFTIDRKGLAALSSSIVASICVAFGKYDVIHYHAEGPCAMLWIPKLFGKRCIVTIHGLDWQRDKWKGSFAAKYIKFAEKVAVKYADEIIVLSRGMKDYFRKTYGRKTRLVPNGASRKILREAKAIRNRYGITKDSYILYLGRLVPEKGLKYLIEAYKQMNTDKRLVIAGGASDTDVFVSEIKEMAAGNSEIIFTGFVQNEVLEELYSNAYLYVLPSDLEGMPLTLLEAMSFGNCVVTSSIKECSEVVEDKAVVFERGNIVDLREKLQALCDEPEVVQRYRANVSDFICQKYDWDTVVQMTLSLYEKNNTDRFSKGVRHCENINDK